MREKNPLVSVVVPVYNVEPYVAECLDSVLAQTYRNIEVVVVDDGSTDGSPAICDQFANKDHRIKVLHKTNGGLSSARNAGLTESRGEWIAFVDSDDYVSPVFVEALLFAALSTNCEIAAIPTGRVFAEQGSCDLVRSLVEVPVATPVRAPDVQRLMLYQALDTGAPWRLYSRHGVLPEDSPFPEGLYYEDLATVYKVVARVEHVALVDCPSLYAYRLRKASIIRQDYRPIKADSSIAVSRQLYADVCAWYPDLADAAASRCFSVNRMVYAQVPADQYAERARLWAELVKYRRVVVADPCARKRERLAAAIACLGEGPFRAFCAACRKAGLLR